jgi:hypothetical protein
MYHLEPSSACRCSGRSQSARSKLRTVQRSSQGHYGQHRSFSLCSSRRRLGPPSRLGVNTALRVPTQHRWGEPGAFEAHLRLGRVSVKVTGAQLVRKRAEPAQGNGKCRRGDSCDLILGPRGRHETTHEVGLPLSRHGGGIHLVLSRPAPPATVLRAGPVDP